MSIPRSWRAGDRHLVWNEPGFQASETITVRLPGLGADGAFDARHAGPGVGGNVSPVVEWSGAPAEAGALWLVVQDPDVPIPRPVVHLSALLPVAPAGEIAEGGLETGATSGVTLLKGAFGSSGWHGPRPVKGHGPHAYVFQLFALDVAAPTGRAYAPRAALRAFAGHVIARGRAQGTFERL